MQAKILADRHLLSVPHMAATLNIVFLCNGVVPFLVRAHTLSSRGLGALPCYVYMHPELYV